MKPFTIKQAAVDSRTLKPKVDGLKKDTELPFSLNILTLGCWYNEFKDARDADTLRNVLYYGYQPLFDALVTKSVIGSQRATAVELLKKILDISQEFLVSYYAGEADCETAHQKIVELEPLVKKIRGLHFKTKVRNIDYNQIYPADVGGFLVKAVDHLKPDVIVGCACGSSEIVLALSGFIRVPAIMIRKSKRRLDEEALAVEEHLEVFAPIIRDSNVLCVEDFVCYGGSMSGMFQKIREFSPKTLTG